MKTDKECGLSLQSDADHNEALLRDLMHEYPQAALNCLELCRSYLKQAKADLQANYGAGLKLTPINASIILGAAHMAITRIMSNDLIGGDGVFTTEEESD